MLEIGPNLMHAIQAVAFAFGVAAVMWAFSRM